MGQQQLSLRVFMDAALIEGIGLKVGLSALILFMMFIIWDLGKRSNAGKFGMMILFIGLGVGVMGFVIKEILIAVLDI